MTFTITKIAPNNFSHFDGFKEMNFSNWEINFNNTTNTIILQLRNGAPFPKREVLASEVIIKDGISGTPETFSTTEQIRARLIELNYNPLQSSGGGGGGAVDSVNGQTGVVVLDAEDVGAIPISGTTEPITGNLEFLNDVIGYTKRRLYSNSNDDYGDNTFEIFMNDPDGGVDVGLKRTNNTTGYTSYVRLYPTAVEFGNDNIEFGSSIVVGGLDIQVLGRVTSRGLSGQQDFTPNITDNDYTQKKYVDTKLAKDSGETYDTNAIKTVTQAEYDALVTPDATTLYFIV